MKKVLAISGSTRSQSTNLNYIKAVGELASDIFSIEIYKDLLDIPAFNPDNDGDHPPAAVVDFRDQLKKADGILICTLNMRWVCPVV